VNPVPPNAPRAPEGRRPDSAYFKYAGAGLTFALTFLVFGALGLWLDTRFGTGPWLMIAGILLGAAGAMYSLVKKLGSSGAARRPSGGRRDDR
jgi:F0F1-type ATP synthase assembly protein I